MPKIKWPTGTVISGTLRTPDLLRAFANELIVRAPNANAVLIEDALKSADEIDADPAHPGNNQCGQEIVGDLFDALNEIAPEGFFFGSHPGDGSDFGFWEDEE